MILTATPLPKEDGEEEEDSGHGDCDGDLTPSRVLDGGGRGAGDTEEAQQVV